MAIESAAVGVLTYRWPGEEAAAAPQRWSMSLQSDRGVVKLEHFRAEGRTAWEGFVSRDTWRSLVDALNESPFPEDSTPSGPSEIGTITAALTWEQDGYATSAQINDLDVAYRDVNEMLLTIMSKIAGGAFDDRGVPAHPNVHVDYSYELKAPRQRKSSPERSSNELAEAENAQQAAEDIGLRGETKRRCLKCGGELVVRDLTSAYEVVCVAEGRVLAVGRGI